MLRPGDTIEYLADVSSPPNQKGIRGQIKIIDRDIPMWTAKFLLRGGKIRPYDPASPLQLEEEETKKDPEGPAEIPGPGAPGPGAPGPGAPGPDAPGPDSEVNTKAKKERRTKANGQRKIFSKTDQAGVPGPKKPDPEGRAGSSGD